jgi:hypothetical protein
VPELYQADLDGSAEVSLAFPLNEYSVQKGSGAFRAPDPFWTIMSIRTGNPAAPRGTTLPLLPFGPDGVRKFLPRRTHPELALKDTPGGWACQPCRRKESLLSPAPGDPKHAHQDDQNEQDGADENEGCAWLSEQGGRLNVQKRVRCQEGLL